jgi:hypothetical protein
MSDVAGGLEAANQAAERIGFRAGGSAAPVSARMQHQPAPGWRAALAVVQELDFARLACHVIFVR